MEGGYYGTPELKRTMNKYMTPHAVVFSSNKVKELFENYSLTPAEFLRPFGSYNGITNYTPFPDANNPTSGKS